MKSLDEIVKIKNKIGNIIKKSKSKFKKPKEDEYKS
jgi:hypothetical protein